MAVSVDEPSGGESSGTRSLNHDNLYKVLCPFFSYVIPPWLKNTREGNNSITAWTYMHITHTKTRGGNGYLYQPFEPSYQVRESRIVDTGRLSYSAAQARKNELCLLKGCSRRHGLWLCLPFSLKKKGAAEKLGYGLSG